MTRPKPYRGSVLSVSNVALSWLDTMVALGRGNASPEGHTMGTSKYWKPKIIPLTPEEIDNDKWERWNDPVSAPRDRTMFLGRMSGTNKAVSVQWRDDCNSFWNDRYGKVVLSQWISYLDFADIRECVWKRGYR